MVPRLVKEPHVKREPVRFRSNWSNFENHRAKRPPSKMAPIPRKGRVTIRGSLSSITHIAPMTVIGLINKRAVLRRILLSWSRDMGNWIILSLSVRWIKYPRDNPRMIKPKVNRNLNIYFFFKAFIPFFQRVNDYRLGSGSFVSLSITNRPFDQFIRKGPWADQISHETKVPTQKLFPKRGEGSWGNLLGWSILILALSSNTTRIFPLPQDGNSYAHPYWFFMKIILYNFT